jgi:hypothetical protein
VKPMMIHGVMIVNYMFPSSASSSIEGTTRKAIVQGALEGTLWSWPLLAFGMFLIDEQVWQEQNRIRHDSRGPQLD